MMVEDDERCWLYGTDSEFNSEIMNLDNCYPKKLC